MAFTRYKVINGRVYVSLEERYREGRKVKSRYLRSLGSFIQRQSGSAGEVQEMRAMENQFYKDKVQREEQATKMAEFKAHEAQMVHEERLIAPDPVPCWEPREVKDGLDKDQETQAPSELAPASSANQGDN